MRNRNQRGVADAGVVVVAMLVVAVLSLIKTAHEHRHPSGVQVIVPEESQNKNE